MKNTLSDLNNHLFEQLERLNDESLTPEELQKEIARARAVNDVAKSIVSNATVQLEAVKLRAEHTGITKDDLPNLPLLKDN